MAFDLLVIGKNLI